MTRDVTDRALLTGVADPVRLATVDRLRLTGHAGDVELDAVVRSLAAGCRVPIAVVNLVRSGLQTYPAEVGVGQPCTQVPDGLSFCAEVVDTGRPLVVTDAATHPVYRANPLVEAGIIGAYAGVPLVHDGAVLGAVSVFAPSARDFGDTDLELLHGQSRLASAVLALRDAARHDALTRLPNRTWLAELAQDALGQAAAAAFFVDVDGFKAVNDVHGYAAGDEVLCALADALAQRVRGLGGIVGRWGGDEFVVVVPRVAEADLAAVGAALLRPSGAIGSLDLTVTVTVGAAHAEPGSDWQDAVRGATAAALAGKRAGRDTVVVCTDEIRDEAQLRDDTELRLRQGLRTGEVTLHYQPMVARDGSVELEALARWCRDGVDVSPAVFVPIAETTNVIFEFGQHVLRSAVGQLVAWRAEHPGAGDVRVWVNTSARELVHPSYVATVLDELRRHGLPGSALGVELTETSAAFEREAARSSLDRLRQAGIRVAIDDFGTGHSSLGRLRQLPVDVLKLDRSLVTGVSRDAGAHLAIVRAVVELGHALSLQVVAEGVEQSTEAEALRAVGCDHLQGWFLGRPAAAAAIPAMLGWGQATLPSPRTPERGTADATA